MVNLELSQEYIALVNERFHDTKPETFDEFQAILVKFHEESMDKSALFSEVKNLFTTHTDLIEKFKDFLDNLDNNRASSSVELTVVEQESKYRRSVPLDEKTMIVLKTCVDFINKVQSALNDDDMFKSFMMMIIEFQRDKDVEKLELEVFFLFIEHPELEIEFSMFLAEEIEGRTIQDMVVSQERKKKEAEDRIVRCKGRKESKLEIRNFDIEEEKFKRELACTLLFRVKEGAERLIMDNSGKCREEKILIPRYFRGLNLEFMRKEMRLKTFVNKCELLSARTMERGKALAQCKYLIPFMERGIEIVTRVWDEKQKDYFRMSRERDLEIPLDDWCTAD